MNNEFQVLLRKRNLKGYRVVKHRMKSWYSEKTAKDILKKLKKSGRVAKIQGRKNEAKANNQLINKWLRGDLDFDRKTMVKLAKVARDTKTVLHVNYGKRSYAEQKALWDKYGSPRAARPGTSRHETGLAADVVQASRKSRNLGDIKGARAAMKKHGLCLPVPNETWHTELGSTNRA